MPSVLGVLTLPMLALYTRWLETVGDWSANYVMREARYLKLSTETVLSLVAFTEENPGMYLTETHVRIAGMLKLDASKPLDHYARLCLMSQRQWVVYSANRTDSYGYPRTCERHELERLARRVMRALEPLKLTADEWRYVVSGIAGKGIAEVSRTVRGFRKCPTLLVSALRGGYTHVGPETIRSMRKATKVVRLRLKYAENDASMRRFARWMLDTYAYAYGVMPPAVDVVNRWRAYIGEVSQSKRSDEINRFNDRMAQRDPKANAAKHPYHYKRRNEKLSDIAWHVCEALARESRESGAPVVVYGRDCEVFFKLLQEFYPDVVVSYVLAPRPLTTGKGKPPAGSDYDRYLRRHIPPNAIHFDSGFAGSIIRWVRDTMGIPVHSIRLISAEVSGYELLGEASKTSTMRNIVLDDIEHVSHRLIESNENSWRAWQFSDVCEQFWARLEGMREGMRAFRNGTRSPASLMSLVGAEDDIPEVDSESDSDDSGECHCDACQGN